MSKECRLHLEQSLASLLEYDIEDVVDFIDPLLSFDSKDDILEYLSGLLGRNDDQVSSFVDDIVKFQKGERVVNKSSIDTGGNNSGKTSSVQKQKKDEEEKTILQRRLEHETREKQQKEDEERRRTQQIQMEKEKNLAERLKLEQQKEMDRIQRENKNAKNQNKNKGSTKKQPPKSKRERNQAKAASSSKVIPEVVKPNRKQQKEAAKTALPLWGKAEMICGCFGTIHAPLTNCLNCGRIICEKEGYGYCPYCSFLVDRPSMPESADLVKAIMHKERLLKFDRESASRTKVFDSQADYYSNSKSNWLTKEEQLDAETKEEDRRKELHSRKYTLQLDT